MIALSDISKQYGRQILFVEASMQLNPGEKVGLVGPNGAGKTTLFRLLSGEEQPDEGSVTIPKRTTIGYFRQDTEAMSGRSVLDEAIAGSGRLGDLHHELKELEEKLADPDLGDAMEKVLERYGEVQDEYQHAGGYDLESRAHEILAGLGFEPDQVAGDVGALSGGWKTRVAMAKVLLMKPSVLLMDEPTNHLDIESILWLQGFLKASASALLLTCHDRDFMNKVVDRIVEIDDGELTSWTGDYDFYATQREMQSAQREAAHARQQAMLAKEKRFIERFAAHAAKAAQVQSRVKKLEKIDTVELPRHREVVKFDFKEPPRSGDDVVEMKGVAKSYGPKTIYDGFDFAVQRGERWCVMGRNGAGKSTLLKLVVGDIEPDAGNVRLGASLKLGYFSQQSLDLLDPSRNVLEQMQHDFPDESQGRLRNLLGAFHFSGSDVDKPIQVLSGGERSRLVLARMLLDPPNFLVLDEPTNHLDLETKEMLVDSLKTFSGTMLFVSHDRTFLKGLASRVLELEYGEDGERRPHVYPGNYVEYVEKTGREAPGVHL
ncbi:MAG: ABC-F family ATP-binding cassette domain-containing protein [Candidatus Eisenbacteria bacterium]|uniref:ABC-F family ATP-binding cassette domain-containing protein n=1 Tax=Eiseniibacteriota bacterium TaxID=2212470 RepID=A0A956NFD3_UNCEI|nr:ABC-F family ATP-binding cassette domain-containing protein [Candidatus Eisenbacteria bacterium]MCB9464214.1 ABC-F family ATP-binding cassette domain-containing protein [Candidatus Eisenbacteria bacterium]